MRGTSAGETLAQQKLLAFEQLQPEFEASFHFVQHMHGQRRFAALSVAETVSYLHALWVCECKERILSVHKNIGRYEGKYCLDLLRGWQEGKTAAVVAFLQRKLDALSFAEIMHQIEEAQIVRHAGDGMLLRLVHGRLVLLNRGMNLLQALDGIFALSEEDLLREVHIACSNYGHTPSQIEQQLAEVDDPLFSYAPHQFLAERNMLVMNTLGMNVMIVPTDLPGERSWKVVAPTEPLRPFAESVIRGYLELLSPTMTSMQKQEQDHFTPATREAIHKAQYEAVRMNVEEVTPEHLFLGILAQDGDGVVETFSMLRLDQEVLRKQAATIFPSHSDTGKGDAKSIPLSKEAQACLEWAISFATNLHVPNVQLEHVLLGSVRHQHLQPLLALFLINAGSILPSYVTERSGLAYTATMDQLITSRIRRRSVLRSNDGVSSSILSSFERPALTFSDIVGFHEVKRELHEVIDFLRNPQLVRQDVRSTLYGLLLVGPAGNSRTLIGQAIAGEGAVPLLSLSIPALFEMASSASDDHTEIFGPVRSPHESGQAEKEMIAQSGRRMIHDLFEQGKKASPCVMYIDTLDALARPEMRDVCQQWQSQLRIEMSGCDNRPAMAVIATISRHGQIEQSLLLPGCFDHTATLDGTVTMPFEAGLTICSACQQEVPAHWKYCGFCGVALARACPHCGARCPDVKGVSFCPECGNQLQEPEKDTLA